MGHIYLQRRRGLGQAFSKACGYKGRAFAGFKDSVLNKKAVDFLLAGTIIELDHPHGGGVAIRVRRIGKAIYRKE